MIGECLSALCMLGIVIVGMLVITRAVTLQEIGNFVGRVCGVAVVAAITVCLLKALVTCVLAPWLLSLKNILLWFALSLIAMLALAMIAKVALSKYKQ